MEELISDKMGQLYLKLDKCEEGALVLFILFEFRSLSEMDAVLAEGRFMSSLAKRLACAEDKRVLSIFEGELDLLHSQAESIGMSLSSFYEGAHEEIEEVYTHAPEKEVAVELEEVDQENF